MIGTVWEKDFDGRSRVIVVVAPAAGFDRFKALILLDEGNPRVEGTMVSYGADYVCTFYQRIA